MLLLKDFKHKMPLKGSLQQKLETLDLRENELLKEIERLNQVLDEKNVFGSLNKSGSVTSLKKEPFPISESPNDQTKRIRVRTQTT